MPPLPDQRRAMPAAGGLVIDVAQGEHPVLEADVVDFDAFGGFASRLPVADLHRPTPYGSGQALGVVMQKLRQRLDQRFFAGAAGGFHMRFAAVPGLRRAGVRHAAPVAPGNHRSIAPNSCTAALRSLVSQWLGLSLNHCLSTPYPTRPTCKYSLKSGV